MSPTLPMLAIVLVLFCSPSASPVSAQADAVDDYVNVAMKERRIPGLSLAVVKDGQVVKAKGYGLANVELNVPASAETVYQSGSVGKQFTATAVLMLVEEGKIGLEDPIGKYLDNAPEIWKDITIRHLLTHTSGIKNFGEKDLNYRLDYTDEELVGKAASFPLDFAPGEKWSYSNTGYVLLGIVVEKASGKFYGDVLRERVFAPLKMDTARVISEDDIIANRAAGYRLVKGVLKNQEYVSPSLNRTADGSLYFTVLDLVKWDAALRDGKLLRKSSYDPMWTPVTLRSGKTRPYGFGWMFDEIRGHKIIEHGGAWQGFTTHIARYVDDRLTVIVLTNLAGAGPDTIAHGVAGLYNPELRPVERKAVQLDPKILDAYVGRYALSPETIFTIVREGNRLLGRVPDQDAFELFAESEAKFFLKVADAQITFVKDERGRVTHLIFHQGGDVEAKKIE
jgi:CubicO group peptidase (beta-lactamase class C family)